MVATVHPLATDAGVAALKRGGNAIDAAVATGLTLGVVDGHNSGVGGGWVLLARLFDGNRAALAGRGSAPQLARAAATRDMFIHHAQANSEASQTGPLASAVPGALALYDEALRRYG